jgi:hypothetical protein
MRLRGATIAATIATTAMFLIGSGAAPASAAGPEPWKPYRSEPWTAPAGKYCTFPLEVRIVADKEEVRVDARYPDGSVKAEEYKGELIVDFVNVDTSESIRRDLSGRGAATYYQDGKLSSFGGVGPFGIGFRAEDDYAQGYYALHGVHQITFDQDGIKHMAVAIGPEENVCETLAS